VDARDDWRWKLERLKHGKYNKPHWLRNIRGPLATGTYRKKKMKKNISPPKEDSHNNVKLE
jgi:hypothetical protein